MMARTSPGRAYPLRPHRIGTRPPPPPADTHRSSHEMTTPSSARRSDASRAMTPPCALPLLATDALISSDGGGGNERPLPKGNWPVLRAEAPNSDAASSSSSAKLTAGRRSGLGVHLGTVGGTCCSPAMYVQPNAFFSAGVCELMRNLS
jgi:hypothetical protein